MTVIDKILDGGLLCPCGHKLQLYSYPNEVDGGAKYHSFFCSQCGVDSGEWPTEEACCVAWLITTAGMIRNDIPPPELGWKYAKAKRGYYWINHGQRRSDILGPWLREAIE